MRGRLALSLVSLFALVVLASLTALWFGGDAAALKTVLEVIVPPIVALTGMALGFYFSERP
jgi:hypothetical protein